MMIVSGVLRKMFTYAAPAHCSDAMGEMRISASTVPSTRANSAPQNVSWMLVQNAPSTSYRPRSAPSPDR